MLNVDHKGLYIENTSEFNREHSPTLPKAFPKELLPQDLCQSNLALLLQCLALKPPNMCGAYNKEYYQCKRERDAQLFTAIEKWEVDYFRRHQFTAESSSQKAGIDQEKEYLAGLETQRINLVKQFDSMPPSLQNKHARWRLAADIEQLKWRHGYLSKSMA